jgi:hypothetical protein
MGLFACRVFRKRESIGDFVARGGGAKAAGSCAVAVPGSAVFDASRSDSGVQFANCGSKGFPKRKNDCKLTGSRSLVAKRRIRVGEEITVGYGPAYWRGQCESGR